MANNTPLRYKISSWKQLPKCLSNTSGLLRLRVGEYTSEPLFGIRISVEHEILGTLFACLVNAHGNLLSKNEKGTLSELTPDQVIEELAKFGFLVTYDPVSALPQKQVEFLQTINKLKYDKIRILSVWYSVHGVKHFKDYIVAFLNQGNPQWLNAGYSPSESEFMKSLSNGTALNLSALSECNNFTWEWLHNFVANIEDVLKDQSNVSNVAEESL